MSRFGRHLVSLRDQLQAVYDQQGRLTPALLVDTARPKNHPLHERFEWDNRIAGEAWRRTQARELIRSVRVTYREPTETEEADSVRAWHAVRDTDNESTYEPAEKIAEDPFLSKLVLREMEREWKQLHRRYGAFAEFLEMVQADLSGEAA